jgi:enoyl-CoA hydratase
VISYEVAGGIAQIVMKAPPVNALTMGDICALRDLFSSLASRTEVKAVVLRAEGQGFSAGLDYKQMQGPGGNDRLREVGTSFREALVAISACPVPVVVAVHGFCMGVGVAIAASCDIVVASRDARFGLPDGSWSISHLRRLVPSLKLRQMALTGSSATAEELHQMGTVYRVVRRGELAAEARAIANALCLQPRSHLTSTKARLNIVDPLDLDSMFAREQDVLQEMSAEPGVRATGGDD